MKEPSSRFMWKDGTLSVAPRKPDSAGKMCYLFHVTPRLSLPSMAPAEGTEEASDPPGTRARGSSRQRIEGHLQSSASLEGSLLPEGTLEKAGSLWATECPHRSPQGTQGPGAPNQAPLQEL